VSTEKVPLPQAAQGSGLVFGVRGDCRANIPSRRNDLYTHRDVLAGQAWAWDLQLDNSKIAVGPRIRLASTDRPSSDCKHNWPRAGFAGFFAHVTNLPRDQHSVSNLTTISILRHSAMAVCLEGRLEVGRLDDIPAARPRNKVQACCVVRFSGGLSFA